MLPIRPKGLPFQPKTVQPEPFSHPEEVPEAEADPMPESDLAPPAQGAQMAQVSPVVARYLMPDQRCGSCSFWAEDGSCQLVTGPIEQEGSCSLWTGMEEPAMDMPEAVDVEPVEPSTGPEDEASVTA